VRDGSLDKALYFVRVVDAETQDGIYGKVMMKVLFIFPVDRMLRFDSRFLDYMQKSNCFDKAVLVASIINLVLMKFILDRIR
jgi:hypothetical protein